MLKKILNNKKLFLIIVLLLLVIISTLIIILFNNKESFNEIFNTSQETDIKNEYEKLNNKKDNEGRTYPEVNISKDNILEYVTISDILNIFENRDDAVIYFGYPSCIYCRNAIQVLVDTAKDTELNVIYYLDVGEKNKDYNKLMTALGDDFITDRDGERSVYAPLVLFVTDGDIIGYNKGTLFSQEDPYIPLDDSQVEGLSEIYRSGINDVISNLNYKKNIKK